MNLERRKRVAEIRAAADDLLESAQAILDEEQEAFDSMPENLQQSERGQAAEEAISYLGDLVEGLDLAASAAGAVA